MAHLSGSTGPGKRPQPTQPLQQQQSVDQTSQFAAGYQQSVHGRTPGETPYQEQRPASPSYDEYQPSLPSITSLLTNVQQPDPQQSSPRHRASLSKGQSSPTALHSQGRQSRSPYPGSGLRRSQPFNPQLISTRRESASLSVPQGWREEPQLHESYLSQPSYPMETQQHQQRPTQPLISPVRTSIPQSYISPQDTPTTQGFDFPYYPQESTMSQLLPANTQAPFYPSTTTTQYLGPGSDIAVQPYPFTPITSQMPSSGLTYVGDSRAMLQGRAVSMGALRGHQRIGTSPQEEDKRRRAASASARFRRRKKEQEEENLKEIARLEKKIEELKKERDYWRDLAVRAGATGPGPTHAGDT